MNTNTNVNVNTHPFGRLGTKKKQVVENILANPEEVKFRELRSKNRTIERTILNCRGGREFLHLLGFEKCVRCRRGGGEEGKGGVQTKQEPTFFFLPVGWEERRGGGEWWRKLREALCKQTFCFSLLFYTGNKVQNTSRDQHRERKRRREGGQLQLPCAKKTSRVTVMAREAPSEQISLNFNIKEKCASSTRIELRNFTLKRCHGNSLLDYWVSILMTSGFCTTICSM